MTWSRTLRDKLAKMNLSWVEAQQLAKDRDQWRELTVASCATGDEEN